MVAANSGFPAPFTDRGDRYAELFRDAGEAMLLVDRVVLDCNPAALKLFRVTRDQIAGHALQNLYPQRQRDGQDSSIAAHEYSKRAARGETLRYDWSFQRPDGTGFDAGVTLSRVGDFGSGCQLAILKEPPAVRASAELEELLAQRTAQLESVTAELDAFSYSVSHDLRAAISGIAACSRIVLEDYSDNLSAEGKRWLVHIHDDSVQLDKFTEALIELSRVSRKTLDSADLDLTAMAHEISGKLASPDAGRTVEFKIGNGLTCRGDAILVRTLLRNLIENGWKFTGKTARGRVEVGCLDSDPSGNKVFYVRDNGAGFDMTQADRLFVAFQRLHRDPDFPGDGIGLATVRRIAHRHGGKVWAEGSPGLGATFYFTLSGHRA
jgi:signal transduction histidine kinase